MKQIKIKDLSPKLVSGVDVHLPGCAESYRENYFEWTGSSLIAKLQSDMLTGGVLKAWRHTPVYREIETHIDAEMFYFVSGVALMLFMDLNNHGQPMMKTAQVVRIQPGTQLVISAGKAHFVPVAEGDEPLMIIVASPKMDAPRMILPEEIEGVL